MADAWAGFLPNYDFQEPWRERLKADWEKRYSDDDPQDRVVKALAKGLAAQDVEDVYEPMLATDHPPLVRRIFGRVYISASEMVKSSVPLWALYIDPARRLLEAQAGVGAFGLLVPSGGLREPFNAARAPYVPDPTVEPGPGRGILGVPIEP